MARHKFTSEKAREAGRKSRRTKAKLAQSFIDYMAGEGAEKAAKILNEMQGQQYIKAYQALAPYVFPRLQAIDIDAEVSGKVSIAPHEWVESPDYEGEDQ